MYLAYAAASAVFAGLTAVLAKIGVKDMDSTLATAVRTVVVAAFAWLMAWITGAAQGLADLSARALAFLTLSGLATGASWLCFYRALQIGDINRVVPIDKSSTVLTMLLALIFLGEGFTPDKGLCMAAIAAGTLLMLGRAAAPAGVKPKRAAGTVYALLSALFASLTSILAKAGLQDVDADLATAVRTTVVLVAAWAIVFAQKKQRELRRLKPATLVFLALSAFTEPCRLGRPALWCRWTSSVSSSRSRSAAFCFTNGWNAAPGWDSASSLSAQSQWRRCEPETPCFFHLEVVKYSEGRTCSHKGVFYYERRMHT